MVMKPISNINTQLNSKILAQYAMHSPYMTVSVAIHLGLQYWGEPDVWLTYPDTFHQVKLQKPEIVDWLGRSFISCNAC